MKYVLCIIDFSAYIEVSYSPLGVQSMELLKCLVSIGSGLKRNVRRYVHHDNVVITPSKSCVDPIMTMIIRPERRVKTAMYLLPMENCNHLPILAIA